MTPQPTKQAQGWQTRRLLSTPRDNRFASIVLGAVLLGISTWWVLAEGAFFGTVLFPGGILLYAVLALMVFSARFPIATRGPHAIALLALVGLGAWTALSMLWTPAQDLALDYAQRSFLYAAAFAIGLVFTVALRQRMALSVFPLLGAGAIAAAVVMVRIWTSADLGSLVDLNGTLDFPFGYRNANAGFFAMVSLGALACAARSANRMGTTAAACALAGVSLSLATVSQSRGSLLAVAAGVVVLVAAARERGRALAALTSVAIPVALAFPELLDPFDAANANLDSGLAELQQAAVAAIVVGGVAALLACAWVSLWRRGALDSLPSPGRRGRLVAWGIAAILAIGAAVAAAGPLSDSVESVSSGDTGYGVVEGSRFTYTGGLNRTDFWRVAINQVEDDPLVGGGAGSFRSRYLLERDADEAPRNAHSIWFETIGELGIVGLTLLCVAFGAAILAALRSRRLGPESAALSSVALTVSAVWIVQASVDWSWYFGGLTAPMFVLLGSAAAPAALSFEMVPARMKGAIGAGAVALALVAALTFASERLTANAAAGWRSDLDGAYGALATAADLNPVADVPLLVEAEIARQSNDDVRALEAVSEAQGREPEDWRGYLISAKILRGPSPELALEQIDLALALNPQSVEAQELRARLIDEAARRETGR